MQGDVLAVLATLPADSVHCVVTSPPYFGLRDYGTGQWEGGSAECDHLQPQGQRQDVGRVNTDGFHGSSLVSELKRKPYERLCGKCGAARIDKQIGLEPTPELFIAKMVEVFAAVRRVMRPDATLWLNLGDAFDSKQLLGMPWRVALALQADGWWLRSDIIWHKPNPMPESMTDRPTKSHEHVFLLTKRANYYFDNEAVRDPHTDSNVVNGKYVGGGVNRSDYTPTTQGFNGSGIAMKDRDYNPAGRNLRDVWTIPSQPYPEAHFATFPEALVERPILAGTSEKGCCAECGAPWERVTEHQGIRVPPTPKTAALQALGAIGKNSGLHGVGWRKAIDDAKSETLGWRPTCTHDAAVVPCTVLDPFAGSGTTLAVARRLGRNGVGIELNPAYVKLAEKRLEAVPLAFGAV